MSYALDGLDNATSLADITLAVNDASGKFLFHGLLLVIFVICFAWYKQNDSQTAFLAALGVANVFTFMFLLANLIILYVAWAVWIISAGILIFYVKDSGGE